MSSWEFLFQQMFSLSKSYWLTQLVVFSIAVLGMLFLNCYGIEANKMSYGAIFAPLLIIFSIPELWKNISTNTCEIENTTYYDLRKVYISRLVLVGMMDLLLLTILTTIMVKTRGYSLYEAGIYFFVPFNFNCCICFSMLSGKGRVGSKFYTTVLCIGEAAIWYLFVRNYHIYEILQLKTWYILLFLSAGYLIFAGKKLIENSKFYLEGYECS